MREREGEERIGSRQYRREGGKREEKRGSESILQCLESHRVVGECSLHLPTHGSICIVHCGVIT